jgi:hypothetical protein
MPLESVSKEPIRIEVSDVPFFFYCRLFSNKGHSRQIYRRLVDETRGTLSSVMWIRELELPQTWAILFFAEDQLTLFAFNDLIREYGTPYRSQFMAQAAERRLAAIENEKLVKTYAPLILKGFPDDRLV